MPELLSRPAGWRVHAHRLEPLPYGPEETLSTAVFERPYERIALFGGVYNNYWGLRAVIADAAQRGAELTLCLGDMGGFGPAPQRIVPLLDEAEIPCLAGNYDISVAQGLDDCGCGYTDPIDNYYAQISYAHTFANTPADHRAWLGALPQQARVRVGDHLVHCCHGSPRRTNEFLWESATSDAALLRFFDDCNAAALAFTHTGIKWHRGLNDGSGARHAVNVGVIGRPENDGTTAVWYTMLRATPDLEVEFVRLDYDHDRLAEEMRAEHLPEEFIDTTLRGWWTTCLEVLPAKERARGRY